jgi:hypothetical protein
MKVIKKSKVVGAIRESPLLLFAVKIFLYLLQSTIIQLLLIFIFVK